MDTLPSLRALQIFEAVGHSNNLAEAARRLHITPGAISQQIKLLEESLGAELTFKDGKRLKLTAAGQRFHESCSHAFELLREARAELDRSRNLRNLSLSALPSLLKTWLAPLVFEWQEAHFPDLAIQFKGSHSEPWGELEDVDFRITYGDANTYGDTNIPTQGSLALYTDQVVPVCSPALPVSNRPLNHPRDILAYPLLSTDWRPKFASPPSWHDWFAAHDVTCTSDSLRTFSLSHMTIESAVAGRGFALAQCSMISAELASGKLMIPFRYALPLPWPYVLKWKHNVFDKSHCRAFHRWLAARGKMQEEINRLLLKS